MPATSRSGEHFWRRSSKRPRRLSLEVEDDDVGFGNEHLAEVMVAVAANPGATGTHPRDRLKVISEFVALREHLLCELMAPVVELR